MIVMQIVSVALKDGMGDKLSHSSYTRVEEWLKHWTCRANFKAVIEDTREKALKHCQYILQKELIPSWLKNESGIEPWMFTFQVSEQEVKANEFWMSSQCVWVHDHEIPKEPVEW